MSAESLLKKTGVPWWAAIRLAACALALGWLATGCDSGSFPVAPSGAGLSVRAIPSTITATGSSTIEVMATEGGLPVRVGTEIRVTTTLGRITNEVITTDADGLAFTTLVADGRLGTATVTARSGAATQGTPVTIGTSVKAAFSSSINTEVCDSELTEMERTVIFTDASTGSPNSWSWDFGDDKGTSSQKDPVYVYDDRGTYLVTLTVTAQGGSDSESKFLSVPGGTCP